MMNNMKELQEKLVNTVCGALEKQPPNWDCAMLGFGEPQMPVELIMEDAE